MTTLQSKGASQTHTAQGSEPGGRWILVLVAAYAALGCLFSVSTPLFEASDELSHYPVVQHIATTGQLPVQEPGVRTLWEQEGSQPPLYYLLGAALTARIDTRDLPSVRSPNPHAKLGIPLDPDNKNMMLHTEAEAFPWKGTTLAVHLLRFLGVALGAATVSFTYLLALAAWPGRRDVALLAAALVGFNPMFLFIAGSVNNDNLAVMLGSWTMLLSLRVLADGLTIRRMLALSVVTALATLTKISGLTLLPVVGLVLLLHGWRTREWRKVVQACAVMAAAWLLVAGWWYVRNLALYGELLGLDTHVAIVGGRDISLWDLRLEWYGFWVSYWALFGAVNILADPPVYWFYALVSVMAAAGLVWWLMRAARRRAWRDLLLPGCLALQACVVFAGLVRWTLITYASQGRLMFIAISALSALTAFGLLNGLRPRWRAAAGLAIGLPMLAIALIIPFRTIRPVYAPPPTVTEVPATATPVGVRFDGLELVAVEAGPTAVEAGGYLPVTLYWRAARPLEKDYSLYLHAFGRRLQEIGKIDTYPGGGTLPTTRMQPGIIIRDTYAVPIAAELQAPSAVRVQVGAGLWTEGGPYSVIPGTGADGAPVTVMFAAGAVYPPGFAGCRDAVPAQATEVAVLGGFARLWVLPPGGTVAAGQDLPVTLVWDRLGSTPIDWTVFVHLVDANGGLVRTADRQPLDEAYPTSLWLAPCAFEDVHILRLPGDLPPGDYRVRLGLYDLDDPGLARAPAIAPDGTRYPDDAVTVGPFTVTNQ